MRKSYCEYHVLELRGFDGPRWQVEPPKFTYDMCYRCGRTWMAPDRSISKVKPLKQVKTQTTPSHPPGGFAVYKIMDGVVVLEPTQAPVQVQVKKPPKVIRVWRS